LGLNGCSLEKKINSESRLVESNDIQRIDLVGGEERLQHRLVVKRVQLSEEEHAQAAHDVIKDNHENNDPHHTREALNERLHDRPQSWQSFHKSKDPQQSQETQHRKTFNVLSNNF